MYNREQWLGLLLSAVSLSLIFRNAIVGLIVVLFLFIHGLGHLLIGYRLKVNLKMTFLYFLGVTETPVSRNDWDRLTESWSRQAIIGIGGPLLPLFVVTAMTFLIRPMANEIRYALFVVSFIHVINLLPVYPLDGGRIFYAFVTSIHNYVFYVVFVASALVMVYVWDMLGRSIITLFLYPIVIIAGYMEGSQAVKNDRDRVSVFEAFALLLIYLGLLFSWGILTAVNIVV